MQRIRKSLIWFMAALLVCSFLPPGPAQRASAADAAATHFLPDDPNIRKTARLKLDSKVPAEAISRDNVYKTMNPTITITGTYSRVSDNSLAVQVQQLAYTNGVWEPVPSRIVTGTIQRENGVSGRFVASNLTLFPGFNRIIFSGMEGNIERSDIFYVLYDQVPFIQNITVYGGTSQIQLNEGAEAVVNRRNVTLQGQVQNATAVTVSLNGAPETRANLLENGMFTTPTLVLQPGRNVLNIKVSNNSDSIQVQRVLYLSDPDDPFFELEMDFAGTKYNVLNTIPTVTSGKLTVTNKVSYSAKVLLPWDDDVPKAEDIEYSLDGERNYKRIGNNLIDDTVIFGTDGITPEYRIVEFDTEQMDFDTHTGGRKNLTLILRYDKQTWRKQISFIFQPEATVVKNVYLLPDFDPNSNYDWTKKLPLDGRELDSPDFYVLVETDVEPSGNLIIQYLPRGNLDFDPVSADGLTEKQQVYKITGLASGQHRIAFYYDDSQYASYTVTLSYFPRQFIDIPNLRDGQTFEFDSRRTHTLTIEGQYIGFEGLDDFSYTVNSTTPDPSQYPPTSGYDVRMDDEMDPANNKYSFKLILPISPNGPIVYGQNTLLFTGTDKVGDQTRVITKMLRIYVIDTNVSTIERFHPVIAPDNRILLPKNYPFDEDTLKDIFRITSEFAVNNDRYVTSETKYDLVMRGSGARYVNLKRGSETVLYLKLPDNPNDPINDPLQVLTNNGVTFDFSGSFEDFILRVRDLQFQEPGTHIYNLELINDTGARTSQRIEIEREQSAFRIFAPQPTVGNQIVVNKNFVRIDIEAEGATAVRVDGKEAQRWNDPDKPNRFYYDYTDLKANKWNDIKVEIVRANASINETIRVYYTGEVKTDAQYMEPLKAKHSVFNKKLELSFPRGTVLMSAMQNSNGVYKYYTDNKLLFGIADPKDGVVERRNDYGHVINTGSSTVSIPNYLVASFNSAVTTGNFTRISDIYWISGGMGEYGDKGDANYKPATNGLPPYSTEGNFATSDFEPERKVVPSQRGTLKISFDENVVDDAAHTVTVFRYTDRGYWENIGGEVDTKNHTITVPFDEFGYYMVMKLKRSYSDITNHPWARNVLNGMYAKGVMNNLRYDEFGADDLTTRGEFVTLLVKGLNLPLKYDDNNTFNDIQPGTSTTTWSYEYIETAARAGIVTGKSVGFFGSEIPITREEAAVMIARALELKLAANDSKLEASLAKTFQDASRINGYARPAVDAVYKAKIMTGTEVTITGSDKKGLNFNPTANLTRAEAAAIAVRMFQRSTNLFPKTLA